MSTPTFAKTHNLITYLEKPTEINDEVRIQALVDGKRVNIKESSIRRILRMGYEKPSDKLTFYKAFFSPQWKFRIHTILQCLSAKTTSWNKFSSTMASAIICLAANQKFNFSRYILLSLVKNIEAGVPFFMFPRKHTKELEVPPTKSQAEHDLPSPSHDPLPSGEDSLKLKELIDFCTNLSNKVLDLESEVTNIKSTNQARIEKLESRVQRLEEENRVLKELKNVHSIVDSDEPVIEKEKSSKYRRKIVDIDAVMLDVNDEEPADVQEVLEVFKAAKLITKVVTTDGVDVNAASVQDTLITAAKATKVQAKDKGKAILIEEHKTLKRQVQIELDEEVVRQLGAELNADINWNAVIEQVKRSERLTDAIMKYQALKRKPLTEA
nr:hypothetical protein [Tanacetum cinerariifolium]